ncbi:MAG: DUF3987 domain-containing protein [Sphingobacteriaceae bacterium]|nr:DUF3987 domain-containing protein [Sphingobacteriaceae bacterium]
MPFKVFNQMDKKAIAKYEIQYNEFDEYQSLSKKGKMNASKIEKPILIKTVLHNFTSEILNQRLNDNRRGCAVVSDELATWLEGMNNYSKSDQTSTYLSFWNSTGISIDRVSKPIPLFIQQPFLNIIGSLQPRVIPKLFTKNKTDNGFLPRFLFAWPDNLEKYPINDRVMNEGVLKDYNSFIISYIENNQITINEETGFVDSKLYYWSEQAKSYYYEWQKQNTIKVNNHKDELKGEIISKYDNHFARLALILQIMEDHSTNEISLKAVQGASALCEYYMENAFKVLDLLKNPTALKEILPEVKLKFLEALPKEFTTSQANALGATFELNEKFVQRFIADNTLFTWVAHGNYRKIIK